MFALLRMTKLGFLGGEVSGRRQVMRAEPLHYFYPVQGIGTSDQMFRSPAQGKNSAVALHASPAAAHSPRRRGSRAWSYAEERTCCCVLFSELLSCFF